ncbi:toll/interleukin-1 receptor domain-containing protein [Plantactinospora veratri]
MTDGTDVFLCYSWVDKRRADELRDALIDAGLTVFQDESGMRDYDHISGRIDTALRCTRVLVVLYTPSLPTSEYCRQEMHFALLRSYRLHRSRARVLAVVQGMDIASVRPGRLKHWRLPRTDSDPRLIAKQIAGYVAGLRDEDSRRLGDAPEPPPVSWRTGLRRDPHELYGREFELWSIHDALFPEDDPAAGGQVAAVTGPGGEGKTMLAEQYARLFADDFPGGVFSAGRGLAPGPGLPYLWLVDDVPGSIDLPAFEALLAPTPEGRTLVTAQHDLQGWVHPSKHIRLGGLGRAAALATLTCRWPPNSNEEPRGVSNGWPKTDGSTARPARWSRRWVDMHLPCASPPAWPVRLASPVSPSWRRRWTTPARTRSHWPSSCGQGCPHTTSEASPPR